jgi:hypothetical protein
MSGLNTPVDLIYCHTVTGEGSMADKHHHYVRVVWTGDRGVTRGYRDHGRDHEIHGEDIPNSWSC